MIIDRIRHLVSGVSAHTDHHHEHEAVVDLLVLVALSDHRISQTELRGLDEFDAAHRTWDEGVFSVHQYLPTAFAKVRSALESPDGTAALIRDAGAAVTTPEARRAAVSACIDLAAIGGTDAEERLVLKDITAALS